MGALVGSCITGLRLSISTGQLSLDDRAVLACAATATSCAGYVNCVTHGHPTCDSSPAAFCDGDTVIMCYNGAPWVRNCAYRGMHCYDDPTLPSDVLHAFCTTGAPCATHAYVTSCSGSVLTQCADLNAPLSPPQSLGATYDCSTYYPGWQCVTPSPTDVADVGGCESPGPSCAVSDTHCEGNVLVDCNSGRALRVDCGAVYDGTCGASSGGSSCAWLSTHQQCDAMVDECMGSTLRTCLNGVWINVDCTAYGFHGCVLNSTPFGSGFGACTP